MFRNATRVAVVSLALVQLLGCGGDPADAAEAAARVACSRNGSACNDGDPCTYGDTCRDHRCAGTRYACDDGNPCTADVCDRGACTSAPLTGVACDDGSACTVGDVCVAGACAGAAAAEVCGNGADDDCDGLADAADPDCAPACSAPPETACANGLDDDCDGLPDRADPDCAPACVPRPEDCGNYVDDDCDGLVDRADPDCDGVCLPSPEIECANGIDDDCDGHVDASDIDCAFSECGFGCPPGFVCGIEDGLCHPHCFDNLRDGVEGDVDCGGNCALKCLTGQHCWSPYDCATGACEQDVCVCKAAAATEASCTNGVDDDCDGLLDASDPDCAPGSSCVPPPEIACTNWADDDCDGLVDGLDPDCPPMECGDGCPTGYVCFQDNRCYSRCVDGVLDGDESDADCGGSCGPTCLSLQRCRAGADCKSGICMADFGVCW